METVHSNMSKDGKAASVLAAATKRGGDVLLLFCCFVVLGGGDGGLFSLGKEDIVISAARLNRFATCLKECSFISSTLTVLERASRISTHAVCDQLQHSLGMRMVERVDLEH